jgi:hypothetical protein
MKFLRSILSQWSKVKYRVSTMKLPNFGSVLKIGKWWFSGVTGILHAAGV